MEGTALLLLVAATAVAAGCQGSFVVTTSVCVEVHVHMRAQIMMPEGQGEGSGVAE